MTFIEQYKEYCTEITDAPEIFHEYVGYWVLSCLIGRKLHIQTGNSCVYPNIYLLCIAKSTQAHKSTAINIGRSFIREYYRENSPNFIKPAEWSHESNMEMLVDDPVTTYFYDEFASLLGLLERPYARSSMEILTSIYDCQSINKQLGTGSNRREMLIEDPFVNILSSSTIEWLAKKMKIDDLMGGFIPRFIVVAAQPTNRVLAFQPPHDENKYREIIKRMEEIAFMASQSKGAMKYTQDAREAFGRLYEVHIKRIKEQDERLCPFIHRLISSYSHRLAIIFSVNRGEFHKINKEVVIAVFDAIDSLVLGMKNDFLENITESYYEKTFLLVKNIIKNAGEFGILRSEVTQKSRRQSKLINEVVDVLKESGLVNESQVRTKGRNGTKYLWLGGGENVGN